MGERNMSNIRQQLRQNNRHVLVQRKNLVFVCRLALKSLIDKSCFESIEEDCEELLNFCTVMEHVLNHRIKSQQKWYSTNEKTFWDYIKTTTRKLPHSCVSSIEAIEIPKTSRGKGRAWLRMALMEKKLSEYLSHALKEVAITRSCYKEGAVMLTEDGQMIVGLLLGLNSIDFSFDIRADNLDLGVTPTIDYTPFLKFEQSPESISSDCQELEQLSHLSMTGSTISDVFVEEEGDDLKTRYRKLDDKYKLLLEQKGYLEELARLRENQLEEVNKQRKKLIDTLHHYEIESRRERQQLESVIIELQAQLQNNKESHRIEQQQLQTLVRHYNSQPPTINQPDIALTDMSTIPQTPAPPDLQSQSSTDSPKVIVHPVRQASIDNHSIMSGSSTISATKDDSQSLVPLTGSFTSETSFKPQNEMMSHQAVVGQVSDDHLSTNQKSQDNNVMPKNQS